MLGAEIIDDQKITFRNEPVQLFALFFIITETVPGEKVKKVNCGKIYDGMAALDQFPRYAVREKSLPGAGGAVKEETSAPAVEIRGILPEKVDAAGHIIILGSFPLGGGAVMRPENVRALQHNGAIFFIDRSPEYLIPTGDRPLADKKEKIIVSLL